ncbi:MAG: hypothetical protein WBC77_08085 [Candidatus Zixiibacteriota bacterium]
MNHLIDTDDKKVADPELRRREQATQFKFLETLIDRLLSTMGFRKTKTPNGCSAILWDVNLLLW